MNIPDLGNLLCRSCARKEGLQPQAAAVWHFVTCVRCRSKEAVTEQVRQPTPLR